MTDEWEHKLSLYSGQSNVHTHYLSGLLCGNKQRHTASFDYQDLLKYERLLSKTSFEDCLKLSFAFHLKLILCVKGKLS